MIAPTIGIDTTPVPDEGSVGVSETPIERAAVPGGFVPESELPSGRLVIMFTDVEDSTPRWEHDPRGMRAAMLRHFEILQDCIAARGGIAFKSTGDGVAAVFESADAAAEAAIEIQRSIQNDDGPWERLKIRVGLHVGQVEPSGSDYLGPPVNRTARIMDVANGDQIAVSSELASMLTSVQPIPTGEHRLKGIGTESIELITAPDLVVDNRPLRTRVARSVKPLPSPTGPTIGREDDTATISTLLEQNRMVTIVGPGGVGKTRLALTVGKRSENRFADGAVWCGLASVADEASTLDAVAKAVGARSQPGMTLLDSIVDFLNDRDMLVVLDNCEHVIGTVRLVADALLANGSVRILTTSRERLGVGGERIYGLDPLDPAGDGVSLFVERAAERDLSFEPTDADLTVIAEICRRLDGIPLGIELAAAWTRVLSPGELLERLTRRLDVLETTKAPGHRQTLRQTVQWSYDQLAADQAELFNRLSVFSGGFSLDAAVAVCADSGHPEDPAAVDRTLDLLMGLLDKSMIASERGTGRIRFRMLLTLQEFGRDRLQASGRSDEIQSRHARHFAALATNQSAALISSKEAEVWDLLDHEWANLRTAAATLRSQPDLGPATRLILDLGWYAGLSMRFEALAWAVELTDADGFEQLPDAGSLLGMRALHEYFTIDRKSVRSAERGLELDPTDPYGFCHAALAADSLNNALDAAGSDELTNRWLATVRAQDAADADVHPMNRMWALGMRVFHLCTHDPSLEAAELQARLTALAERSGSATAQTLARWAGGMVASFGSVDDGLAEWRQGVDSARSLSDVHLLIHLIVGLELHVTSSRGDIDQVLDRSLTVLREAHDQHYLAGTSHLFGVAAIVLTRVDRAEIGAQLLGSMTANGHQPRRNAVRAIERAAEEADDGPAAIERARSDGATLSTNDAAALAIRELEAAITDRAGD